METLCFWTKEVSRRRLLQPCAFLLMLVLAAGGATAAQVPWKPAMNVEIIVGVGPGGGVDRTERTLQKILQDRRWLEVSVAVVNMPGGGGILAQAYLNQHAGDAHYLEVSATSLLTNHITGKTAHAWNDFTPIAMLYDEFIGFAVKADSPLKTGRDLAELLRRLAGELLLMLEHSQRIIADGGTIELLAGDAVFRPNATLHDAIGKGIDRVFAED